MSPKFSLTSFYDQLLSKYCTFYDFPIDPHVKIILAAMWSHVNENEKKIVKYWKSENFEKKKKTKKGLEIRRINIKFGLDAKQRFLRTLG